MSYFNGRVIRSRERQLPNALPPIVSNLSPNFTSVRASQPANAPASTILTDGRLMFLKDSQLANALIPTISSLPHSTSVRTACDDVDVVGCWLDGPLYVGIHLYRSSVVRILYSAFYSSAFYIREDNRGLFTCLGLRISVPLSILYFLLPSIPQPSPRIPPGTPKR
jgi:hypothetical protein